VVNPFAELIRVYQRYVWLPGTVYGLILLVGLFGVVFRWRRAGRDALLPWLCSVALIVAPAATAEFDYRYVTTAAPFACLAALLSFSPPGRQSPLSSLVARQKPPPSSVQTAERPFGSKGDEWSAGAVVPSADGTGGEPGGAPLLPRRVPGSGLRGGLANARHNKRDLPPDAP